MFQLLQESLQQACSTAEVDIDQLLVKLLNVEKALAGLRPGQCSSSMHKCMATLKVWCGWRTYFICYCYLLKFLVV